MSNHKANSTLISSGKKPVVTPLEAIAAHCAACSIDVHGGGCDCFAESCHLWPFRFGTFSGGAA